MGCNSKCAYCIVPAVRGREQSRRPGEIVAEVTAARTRRREGDHPARPERQLLGPRPRARAAHRVRRAPARLRRGRRHRADPLHEPAPEGLPRARHRARWRNARRSASTSTSRSSPAPRVCSSAMRRTYDRERYLRLVDRLRAAIPDLALGTDLIVGFPGETDEDFEQTLEVVEAVRYDSAFTFIFSPRAGHRGGGAPGPGARRRQARAPGAAGRASSSASPPSGTRSGWAAWRRCSSRDRAGRAGGCCGAGPGAARPSTSPAPRSRATSSTCGSRASTSTTLRGRAVALAAGLQVVAVFGPTASGKTGVAEAAGRAARHRGRLRGRAPGVPGSSDPHEPAVAPDATRRDP